ncbi:MAG: hypothetical protein A2X18_06810 [Bacteroidetes bacterium GWF2_40_14]|nr:MAG: hypothetical protein A2X18_06810 [Bacteroidetes bacterium GWF2_40_14]
MRFALIGDPISHSLSPALFRAAYRGSVHSYELLFAATVEEAVMRFHNEGFNGLNVTTPYKEDILRYADKRDHLTDIIGASNLILKEGNQISAYNTDFYGVKESIGSYVCKGDKVVVLGCGGAGRAAAVAAKAEGCRVTIVNRSESKAKLFSDSAGIHYKSIEHLQNEIKHCTLFINTLSLSLDILNKIDFTGKIVFEANYKSPQLSEVENLCNAKYISGKYWLLNQAVQSFQLFTSTSPNVDSMRLMLDNI